VREKQKGTSERRKKHTKTPENSPQKIKFHVVIILFLCLRVRLTTMQHCHCRRGLDCLATNAGTASLEIRLSSHDFTIQNKQKNKCNQMNITKRSGAADLRPIRALRHRPTPPPLSTTNTNNSSNNSNSKEMPVANPAAFSAAASTPMHQVIRTLLPLLL
jgi:hypothetical protein